MLPQRLLIIFILIFGILTFVSTNRRVNAETSTAYRHTYKISPDGNLVADFCYEDNHRKKLIVYDSNGSIRYSSNSVSGIEDFSPDGTQLLYYKNGLRVNKDCPSKYKSTVEVWNNESQRITTVSLDKLKSFTTIKFLGNSEIAYIEDTNDFSFANFAKLELASNANKLMPSKLHQHILIKSIQDGSPARCVKVTLGVPQGWFGQVGGGMLCAASNGKYFTIRCLNGDLSNNCVSNITSFALFNSLGQKISSIMNLPDVLFPLCLSDDGKRIITHARSYERSKLGTAQSIVTTEKWIGDILTDREWSTGAIRWERRDIRFYSGGSETFGDFSSCNGRIAALVTTPTIEQSKPQWIEIINEDSGKTERTFALDCNDVQSIRLTTSNTVVIIHRDGQRQICYIDSGEIK